MYILNERKPMQSFEERIDIILGTNQLDPFMLHDSCYFATNRELNTPNDYKEYEKNRQARVKGLLNMWPTDKMINLLSFKNYEFNGKKSELLNWLYENGLYMESRNIKNWFIYTRKKGSK